MMPLRRRPHREGRTPSVFAPHATGPAPATPAAPDSPRCAREAVQHATGDPS
ncbi:hypothetical protein OV450_0845 [Actinobacteria bacterium OV450]|nr:hypothetical protein OV450_0845 [Actinobacteria bacterium OV450]